MAAREIRAGKAYVEMSLKNNMERDLKRAQQQLNNFAAGVAKVGTAFLAMGAAVLAPMAAAVKAFLTAGGALDDMSQRTGVSVEALSELAYAAELSGSSIDALGGALFRMRRRIANAAMGTGPAVRGLEALGLSAEKLTQLPVQDQFLTIADALARIKNPSEAAQYGFEVLGDGFKALMPLMANGGAGIETLMQQARDLGLTMTGEDATAAAVLGDHLATLGAIAKATAMQIGAALVPSLTKIVEPMIRIAAGVVKLVRDNRALVVQFAKWAAAGVAVAGVLLATAAAIKVTAIALGVLAAASKVAALGFAVLTGAAVIFKGVVAVAALVVGAVLSILNPVTLVVAAVIGIGTAAAIMSSTFRGHIGRMLEALSFIPRAVGEVGQRMVDIFAGVFDSASKVIGMIATLVADGQIQAGVKLLWAALKTEWARGTAALQAAWSLFQTGFLIAADAAFFGVASIANETVAVIRRAWLGLSNFFRTFWATIAKTATDAFSIAALSAEKTINRIRGAFDSTFNVRVADREAEKRFTGRNQAAEQQLRVQTNIADAMRVQGQRDIEQTRSVMGGIIKAMQGQRGRERDAQLNASMAAAEESLAQAQKDFAKAMSNASRVAADGSNEEVDFFAKWQQWLDDMQQGGIQTQEQRGETLGTFNAAVVSRIFAGDDSQTQSRIARATEASERLLRDINRHLFQDGTGANFT